MRAVQHCLQLAVCHGGDAPLKEGHGSLSRTSPAGKRANAGRTALLTVAGICPVTSQYCSVTTGCTALLSGARCNGARTMPCASPKLPFAFHESSCSADTFVAKAESPGNKPTGLLRHICTELLEIGGSSTLFLIGSTGARCNSGPLRRRLHVGLL